MSEVVKSTLTIPSFVGAGCSARVTDQVVLEVVVPGEGVVEPEVEEPAP